MACCQWSLMKSRAGVPCTAATAARTSVRTAFRSFDLKRNCSVGTPACAVRATQAAWGRAVGGDEAQGLRGLQGRQILRCVEFRRRYRCERRRQGQHRAKLDEAAHLLGRPVSSLDEMTSAAADRRALGAPAVLLKGGHLAGDTLTDVLATRDGTRHFRAARLARRNPHGTGCTLSSAIAEHLAQGLPLHAAVAQGRAFVREAIAAGAGARTGQGSGPLNHRHAPRVLQPR